MHVRVLYFAVFRERLARDEDSLELPDTATVRDAIDALAARHAAIAQLRGRFRVAVDHELVGDDHALADGVELALIPPVAGGASSHVLLTDRPLSLDRCIAAVRDDSIGGICTFLGLVRAQSRGHTIVRLEYEAYAAMATQIMQRLVREVEAEIPGARLAVEHRVGTLVVGDAAVAIVAAAPHRAEAFAACRAMIDRLKDQVPIWKKEFSVDGEEWIGLGP
jgi:molybdopterin converting factor subunit 1